MAMATFAGQVHQESAWRPDAISPVGAQGMAQFMPATATWIAEIYPALVERQPLNASWALRALVTYDRHLWDRIDAATACDRMAMTLAAYNGGPGWLARDKTLASSKGLDSRVWWGAVESVNAGRLTANWNENLHWQCVPAVVLGNSGQACSVHSRHR
jgi:soluble lytic murein transglycosylase-like protein